MPFRSSRRAGAPAHRASALRPLAIAAHLAGTCGLLAVSLLPTIAQAQAPATEAVRSYDIPAGPLAPALTRFIGDAGVFMAGTSELTQGKTTAGLRGTHTVAQAFALLLAGTGLEAVARSGGGYVLRSVVVPAAAGTAAAETTAPRAPTLPAVRVTASAEQPGGLPKPYAGGNVARGGGLGLLGNKDFMDTPFSTLNYTAQTIEDQQARSIADVLDNTPSFRPIYPGNDAMTDFAVRGNKVRALDSAYGGLYGLMSPGVEALERIEVLSGANALLNGLGPVGGVGGSINQVPKRAGDTPLTRLTTGFVSDAQFGVKADIGRRFGDDNRFGLRFNGAYSNGDTAVDQQRRQVAMGALALDFRGDRVRLAADIGYRRNNTDSPSRTTFVGAGFVIPPPPSSGKNWQQAWSYDNVRSTMAAVRGEVDLAPDVTAFAAIGTSTFEESQLFANTLLQSNAGGLAQAQVYWPLYRDSSTAEAGLRGVVVTGPVKHNWSLATSALRVRNGILLNTLAVTSNNLYTPVVVPQPSIAGLAGPGTVPKTASTDFSGVAVADTLSALDNRVQLTLGLRQQTVKSGNYNPTTGASTSSYDKSVTTPGVGLVVKPRDDLSLYANYIEGLQQGPTAVSGSSNVGEVFAPYVSKQVEAGVKVDLGRFATTFSVYQLKTPNGLTDPVSRVYAVNGEQRTRGIELNTFGEITRGVRLLGGIALIDAKQTRTAGGATDGKQVTGAPRTQLNLGGEWDVWGVTGLTVSARAIHTGNQFVDALNRQPIASWTRYDVGMRYKTTWADVPTTLRLNVQNVFDKSYWASAIDSYLVQSTPRTVQLSATFDF